MLIGVAILDIGLMVWTPSGNSSKSPWAVPLVSCFFLLLLAILLSGRADQALGRRMQATENAEGAPPAEQAIRPLDAHDVRPVPVFAIEMLEPENLPPLSPDARLLVQRGQGFYTERLRIYRRGVALLSLAHLAVALLGRALDSPYPIPFGVWSCLLVTIVALIALGHPGRIRLILAPAAWRILSAACGALTITVAVIYVVRGISERDLASGLLTLVTVGALAAYALRLRRGNRELRRKVMAHPPLKLLFLWVFGSYSPVFLFLGLAAVWRFLGSIQVLNGAGFMGDTVEIVKSFARRRSGDLVVKTPEQLAARIATFNSAPNRLGMYAHNTLLCSDSVWKRALDAVLQDTHVILMDLRGFSPGNQGATYELGQLIDRFPAPRFVLLADETTDLEFLQATLRHSWEAMAIDSPNRHPTSAPVRVLHLGHASAGRGGFPQLPAIAREGDHLVGILCERAVAA